jgi:hypothetical protein
MVEVFKFGQMRVHSLCVDGREFLPKFLQRVSPRDLYNVKKESNASRSNGPHRLCSIGFCVRDRDLDVAQPSRSLTLCRSRVIHSRLLTLTGAPIRLLLSSLVSRIFVFSFYLFYSINLARSTNRKVPSISPFNN